MSYCNRFEALKSEEELTNLSFECVWYCGSYYGCDLKKIVLKKVLLVVVSLKK
jgi:hypothetical protein